MIVQNTGENGPGGFDFCMSKMEETAAKPLKVLFVGDVGNEYDALFTKVSKLVAKKGEFDALFCFSSSSADQSTVEPYLEGQKPVSVPTYVVGKPQNEAVNAMATREGSRIRFLGSHGIATVAGLKVAFLSGRYNAAAYASNASDASNTANISAEDAASPSTSGSPYFTKSAVDALKSDIMQMEGDLDLLLTCEWPEGVDKKSNNPVASWPVAEVALAARPRYHISGPATSWWKAGGQADEKKAYYQRLPYVNEDRGAGKHATRFIGLGSVANVDKQQWMQALALVPCESMPEDQFRAIPADATACPYKEHHFGGTKRRGYGEDVAHDANGSKRTKMAAPSEGRRDIVKDKSKTIFVRNVPFAATEEDIIAYFSAAVGTAGTVEDVVRRKNHESGKLNTWCHVQFSTKDAMERACQVNEQELMGRKLHIEPAVARKKEAKPVDGCWFCLSNPNADVQLVASVGQESYVALDKGPINDTHVLILPIEHHACSIDLPQSTLHEVARYTSALSSYFASKGKLMVGFERFMRLKKSGGNHCHINLIGVDSGRHDEASIRRAFEDAGRKLGHGFVHVSSSSDVEAMREGVRDVVGDGEYFSAILPDGSRLVHPLGFGDRHPLAFGREVLAGLAGVPERADWKVCKMADVAEEEKRCAAFKGGFKEFDVMMM